MPLPKAATFALARRIAPGALLVALVLLAYLPALRAGYIWDDDQYVTQNRALRSVEGLVAIWTDPRATPQYYPLVHTSFWLEYRLWGLHPAGFHLVNMLLHGLGAALLWRVLRRLGLKAAWPAAAIFALHPINVESVAWITERKNVLSGVFYFASALAYLRFAGVNPSGNESPQKHRRRFYVPALALFLAALLAKTVAATLPAALALIFWWKRGRLDRRDLFPLIPFFILGAAFGLMTAWLEKHHVGASGEPWDLSLIDRLLIAGRALWFYAGKLLAPLDLAFIYPRFAIDAGQWHQYLYPLAALGTLALLWALRGRIGRGPLTAALFFAGTLFPALGFFDVYPFRYSFVADHFQYLAGVGLIALFAEALRLGWRRLHGAIGERPTPGFGFRATLALLLLALGALTWRQTLIYRNEETLWRDTLEKNPAAIIAYTNLGSYYARQGRLHEALATFNYGLERAPDDADMLNNLGSVLLQLAEPAKAVAPLRRSLELEPANPQALNNLGLAYLAEDKPEQAVPFFRQALRLKPEQIESYNNLASALSALGRPDAAIAQLQQALQIAPENPTLRANLAKLQSQANGNRSDANGD